MGTLTKRQQQNFDLFDQLDYETLDLFIKGKQAESYLPVYTQKELKIAKIVRRKKKRESSK